RVAPAGHVSDAFEYGAMLTRRKLLGDAVVTDKMRNGSPDLLFAATSNERRPIDSGRHCIDRRRIAAIGLPGRLHDSSERAVVLGRDQEFDLRVADRFEARVANLGAETDEPLVIVRGAVAREGDARRRPSDEGM